MTPEQEHFWKVLKFDAKTMAVELGSNMKEVMTTHGKNSKKFHATVDRCFFLIMDQAQNELDVIKIVKYWLSTIQLPLNPSKLESADIFHNRYGNLVLKLINTDRQKLMEWD